MHIEVVRAVLICGKASQLVAAVCVRVMIAQIDAESAHMLTDCQVQNQFHPV